MQSLPFKRILLKLSGEAFQDHDACAIHPERLTAIADEIACIAEWGVQVALVLGGGNFLRGAHMSSVGLNRVTADQMGMLSTIMNGLALRDTLKKRAIGVKLFSALAIPGLVDFYDRFHALSALEQNKVVIFVGGTGNPLVTTDSAAALRGIEMEVDIVLKGTKVNGVFAADPIKNPKAQHYTEISYDQVIEQRLGVMDLNAILLCQDNALPLRVFNMNEKNALQNIVQGKSVGTLISQSKKES